MTSEETSAVKQLHKLLDEPVNYSNVADRHVLADDILLDLVAIDYPKAYELYRELEKDFLYE